MTDTHTHLYLREYFPNGGVEAVRRAMERGVEKFVLPNIDLESTGDLLALHRAFPEQTRVAAGLHPTEIGQDWKSELEEIFERFSDVDLCAIGEIGVDKHWDTSNLTLQMDAFGYQLELARERGLPAIIHSRDAIEETLEIVGSFGSRMPEMVFHSFTYGPREADKILERAEGCFFGFNGVITFKNADEVREAASLVGIERIVAETDSPFLAPVPKRGETNESAFLPYIVEKIAEVAVLPLVQAREIIDRNSLNLFNL